MIKDGKAVITRLYRIKTLSLHTKYDKRRITENHSNRRRFPDRANYVTTFSIIVSEPMDNGTANVVKDVVKDVVKELSERQRVIIKMISADPFLSAKAISEKMSEKMSEKTGIVPRTIQRDLAELQTKGIIVREGGRKEGKWVIIVK